MPRSGPQQPSPLAPNRTCRAARAAGPSHWSLSSAAACSLAAWIGVLAVHPAPLLPLRRLAGRVGRVRPRPCSSRSRSPRGPAVAPPAGHHLPGGAGHPAVLRRLVRRDPGSAHQRFPGQRADGAVRRAAAGRAGRDRRPPPHAAEHQDGLLLAGRPGRVPPLWKIPLYSMESRGFRTLIPAGPCPPVDPGEPPARTAAEPGRRADSWESGGTGRSDAVGPGRAVPRAAAGVD